MFLRPEKSPWLYLGTMRKTQIPGIYPWVFSGDFNAHLSLGATDMNNVIRKILKEVDI